MTGNKAVDEFAQNLGVAFQIQDDILDVTGDEKEFASLSARMRKKTKIHM